MTTRHSPSLAGPCNTARRLGLLTLLAATSLLLGTVPQAYAQGTAIPEPGVPRLMRDDTRAVAPALERYAERPIAALWRRPDLSPRDRSLVTLTALITRGQTAEVPAQLELALDHGVSPREVSEVVTHLAFYAGWGNAMAALPAVREVFVRRGISREALPAASPRPLPLDEAAEARRAAGVDATVGPVVSGLPGFTTDVLFRDLWLRPDLAPRDRSLVTVSALITAGQVAQVPYYLNRAMDAGLTRAQAAEVVTHLAFYAGWPNAFSSVPVLKGVFDARPN